MPLTTTYSVCQPIGATAPSCTMLLPPADLCWVATSHLHYTVKHSLVLGRQLSFTHNVEVFLERPVVEPGIQDALCALQLHRAANQSASLPQNPALKVPGRRSSLFAKEELLVLANNRGSQARNNT